MGVLAELARVTGDAVAELPVAGSAHGGVGEERIEVGRNAIVGPGYPRAANSGGAIARREFDARQVGLERHPIVGLVVPTARQGAGELDRRCVERGIPVRPDGRI